MTAPASRGELAGASAREQTRARYPDEEGYAERDGVRIFWERYGDGEPTVRRVIRTKPSLYYEAGDRTGRLPETLDLDFSSFLEAFNAATAAKTSAKPASAGKPAPAAASK